MLVVNVGELEGCSEGVEDFVRLGSFDGVELGEFVGVELGLLEGMSDG